MRKRSSTGDDTQSAFRVVEGAIGGRPSGAGSDKKKALEFPRGPKNPAAVALGRLGGKRGGPARAAKLTAERKKEIAAHAARARWAREPVQNG